MTIRSRDRKRAEENSRRHARITPNKSSAKGYTQTSATPEQIVFKTLCESGVSPDVAKSIAYKTN